jgi:hypothetical protein
MKQHHLDQRITDLASVRRKALRYAQSEAMGSSDYRHAMQSYKAVTDKMVTYATYHTLRAQYTGLQYQFGNACRTNQPTKSIRAALADVWVELEPIAARVKQLEANRKIIVQ